ncbi:hypothetical protein GTW51_22505 [Aurantimonas aggregata]|uniref:Uncharacterized protein n=1 Tax=Aurantimonas aggregata TaxID=2047720 RepID=A0A6L9MNN0_9HYPH|nr:hypothetical protein [Aurantimonas aggregata]NDV89423.1 hypothetical protein [Aurantimonas aggregata]
MTGSLSRKTASRRVRRELTGRFGGLTAHTRSPAEGRWKQEGDLTSLDEIVILEVMMPEIDEAWWCNYRCEPKMEVILPLKAKRVEFRA